MTDEGTGVALGVCLQCDTGRYAVRRDDLSCGVVDTFGELEIEFPRHRWADWSNRDLDQAGVLPHAYDRNRRTSIFDLAWLPCADLKRGHVPWLSDFPDMNGKKGDCSACGASDVAAPDPAGNLAA